ncbi:MAG: hypothetical protein DWQ08_03550 [Proteobacteria bacterium]|nr:MAG: hypothetical protein DWQ08_03550 [Pseudomonadota bacterium]
MSLAEVFPGIDDFLILTQKGVIGRFVPGEGFRAFQRLSDTVSSYSKRLLEVYQNEPESAEIRPAIVLPAHSSYKWGSATLMFDRRVLHRVFPSGTAEEGLTPFQARNRMRSIYQGMELLINHENKSVPGVAFYCPILFGRGSTLVDYPAYAESIDSSIPRDSPVVEVLNFIALLPPRERRRGWASELVRMVRNISIEVGRRSGSSFEIQE